MLGHLLLLVKWIETGSNDALALVNIHKILGLTDMLQTYGFSKEEMDNFELLFSNINGKPEYAELQQILESEVRDYFKSLQLPDEPTIYDLLILSLTEKDAIITFNWDPLLMQAYRMNLSIGNLPQLIFPHGMLELDSVMTVRLKDIQELNHMYASSRHAKIVLLRDDREVAVHFYALSVQ